MKVYMLCIYIFFKSKIYDILHTTNPPPTGGGLEAGAQESQHK